MTRARLLLAHPGTQHAPRLASELENRDLLEGYWTGLAFTEKSLLARAVGTLPPLRRLARRVICGVPSERLHTIPFGELTAHWHLRRGADELTVLHGRNSRFQAAIPTKAIASSKAVIGFDTSGWVLASRCEQAGVPFILDRTIAHPAAYTRIMAAVAARYPGWFSTEKPRPAELVAAETEEHEKAARIVVGGTFTRDTLVAEGIDPQKIVINPYGVEWDEFAPAPNALGTQSNARKLRFLFVGSVISRKGVPLLLDAWRALAPKDAELWIAGRADNQVRALIPRLPGLRLLGSVPRYELAALYASCDVLVLPSLFEGFGLVLLEALAAGLPVIATSHTGAVDYVTSPVLGTVVPAGSTEALIEGMRAFQANPPQRSAVLAAAAPLATTFSWQAYGERWAALSRTLP
jgi:starch synthase